MTRAPAFLLILFLTACAASRPIVKRDGQLEKEGYYRIGTPQAWRPLTAPGEDIRPFSLMASDARFVRCPQGQIITIGRAAFRQRAAAADEGGDKILLGMATRLLDEIHSGRQNPPARTNLTADLITMAGQRTVQVTFESQIPGGSFCDPGRPAGQVKERYYLVDSGGRGMGLALNAGRNAQQFVFLHFESPAETFAGGLSEFDQLAGSLALAD